LQSRILGLCDWRKMAYSDFGGDNTAPAESGTSIILDARIPDCVPDDFCVDCVPAPNCPCSNLEESELDNRDIVNPSTVRFSEYKNRCEKAQSDASIDFEM
jgi:hypothetical protein